MKKCPFCAEEIQEEAIKCRYCESMLVEGNKCQSTVLPQNELSQHIFQMEKEKVMEKHTAEMAKLQQGKTALLSPFLVVLAMYGGCSWFMNLGSPLPSHEKWNMFSIFGGMAFLWFIAVCFLWRKISNQIEECRIEMVKNINRIRDKFGVEE